MYLLCSLRKKAEVAAYVQAISVLQICASGRLDSLCSDVMSVSPGAYANGDPSCDLVSNRLRPAVDHSLHTCNAPRVIESANKVSNACLSSFNACVPKLQVNNTDPHIFRPAGLCTENEHPNSPRRVAKDRHAR